MFLAMRAYYKLQIEEDYKAIEKLKLIREVEALTPGEKITAKDI